MHLRQVYFRDILVFIEKNQNYVILWSLLQNSLYFWKKNFNTLSAFITPALIAPPSKFGLTPLRSAISATHC